MRDKIKLVSTGKKISKKTGEEVSTGHFYTTNKNKRTTTDKIVMKKFDPVIRKHVDYKEAKIK